jgi:methionyl-tRNA synthetase
MIFLRSLFIVIIFQFKAFALIEVDITRGNLSPLPIAVSPLAMDNESLSKFEKIFKKKNIGAEISKIVEDNLKHSGLFNPLSKDAFLQAPDIANLKPRFEDWNLIKAQALITGCSALNQFFDKLEPWKKIKSDDPAEQMLCAQAVERCIAHLDLLSRRLSPFCPRSSTKLSEMLGDASSGSDSSWGRDDVTEVLAAGTELGTAEVLFAKIDSDAIAAEIGKLGGE